MIRRCGLIALVGGILGIGYGGGFPQVGWGPPGTDAYEIYQNYNRLQIVPLLLQLIGLICFVRQHRTKGGQGVGWGVAIFLSGYVLWIIGIVGEFWVFTEEPYTSDLRSASYSLTGFGFLMGLVGLLLIGITFWRSKLTSTWISGFLILSPIFLVAAVIIVFVAELEALDPVTVQSAVQGLIWLILGLVMLRSHTQLVPST